ncbi:MAG: heparinase II/III family protein, partial [Clostridia bacterium]|nr:heparinase II/III family protein [Clostridia bacterium]
AVIIDAGGGRYMNSQFRTHENSWNRYSGAHNVPLINGFEQGTGKKYRSKNEVLEGKCLTLDITEAYPAQANLERFIRRAEIKDGSVVITDDIALKSEGEVDFVFMTVGEPKLANGKILLDAGRVMHYPSGLVASVEKMDTEACGADRRSNAEPVLHRIHLKAKTKGGTFVFTIK